MFSYILYISTKIAEDFRREASAISPFSSLGFDVAKLWLVSIKCKKTVSTTKQRKPDKQAASENGISTI